MLFLFHWRIVLGCALVHSMEKFFQVHAYEDGKLHVQNNEELIIDTSSLKATIPGKSPVEIKLSPRQGTVSVDGQNFTYYVAELRYKDDITFDRGSTVSIKGNRSLSIQSKNGNIVISTDLNLTCENSNRWNETCLGGYSVSESPKFWKGPNIYTGDGPGWKEGYENFELLLSCVPGAAHGGIGGMSKFYSAGITKENIAVKYGKDDFKAMLGGSGGFLRKITHNVFYGGGAIELIAEGTIDIDATISAKAVNGFQEDSSAAFSGSSGGLIRLIAKEVKMTKSSSLNVDGGNASTTKINTKGSSYNNGGSGGVIQINASEGILYNVFLAGGQSHCIVGFDQAEDGYLIIKGIELSHEETRRFIESYRWPNVSQTTPAPTTTPAPNTTKEDFLFLCLKDLTVIREELKAGIFIEEHFNTTTNNLNRLMNFSTAHNYTKKQLLIVVGIFENYTEIIDRVLSLKVSLSVDQEVYRPLLRLASVVIAENNQQNWKELEKLPYLASLLEKMAISISANFTLNYETDTIIVQSNQFDPSNADDYSFPVYSKLTSTSFVTKQDFIKIPKLSLYNPPGEYKFITLLFKNVQDGLPEQSQQSTESSQLLKVASLLMTCSLLHNGVPVTKLASPAFLHFALNKSDETKAKTKCSFWNTKNSSWDDDGVSLEELQPTKSICKTTHFTSFAVLMQHTAIELTKTEELSLQLITYIGCGISTGTLLIALIVFLSIEGLTSDRHRIHLNLVIALLLAQILFLTGIRATEHEILCRIIAGTLHYLFLVAFMWMLIEGVHLYLKVVKVFGIENIKMKQYLIIGWGIPGLIVGGAAIYKPLGYGTKYVCWLSLEDGYVWAFIGPAVAIVAINCVILVVVIKTVVASASTMKSSEHSHIKAGIKGALVLMPLMGITWVFGLLAVNKDSLVFQYVFSIANSLQGFFIFLLHIVFNTEVRMAFKRQREKRQMSKESADYNPSISYSSESDRKTWGKSMSSDNTLKNGLDKLRARMSFSVMPRTSRVISVQPMKSIDDEVQIKRKLDIKSLSNKETAATLHCPKERDLEPKPPHHSPLTSDLKTSSRFSSYR